MTTRDPDLPTNAPRDDRPDPVDLRTHQDPSSLIASLARSTPTGRTSSDTTSADTQALRPTQPPSGQNPQQPHPGQSPHTQPQGMPQQMQSTQPPPPPGQRPPERATDALPYPETDERRPVTLVAMGVGIGLALLAVIALVTVIGQSLGGSSDGEASAPTASPTLITADQIAVTASSTQESEGGITYSAENTLDGRPETAWNSDGRKDGPGPGITITYGFGDPVDLHSISVLNGYQKTVTSSSKTSDLYDLNSRVRLIRVVTDNATFTWELTDERTSQTLTKDFGRTSSVRFEMLSVYPGSKYLDLALSEVSFRATG